MPRTLVKEETDSALFSHCHGKKRINLEKLRTGKLKATPHKEGKLIYTVCVFMYMCEYIVIYMYIVCVVMYICVYSHICVCVYSMCSCVCIYIESCIYVYI